MIVTRLYRKTENNLEYCFNIGSSIELNNEELDHLRLILADGLLRETVTDTTSLSGSRVVEVATL